MNIAEKRNMWQKRWREANPERMKELRRRSYQKNKDRYASERALRHIPAAERARRAAYTRAWRLKNPGYMKGWSERNRVVRQGYYRDFYQSSVTFRLGKTLRARLIKAIRGTADKSGGTFDLLGCSLSSFKLYLESKFEPGMTWENYGKGDGTWQIDHIIPCAIFDLTRPDHQERCFHFSNLQPLWTLDNMKKGKRISQLATL